MTVISAPESSAKVFWPYLDRAGVTGDVIGNGQGDLVAARFHHLAQVESVAGGIGQLEGLPAA